MKYISYHILLLCIFLFILSQFTSCKITDCCGIGPYISEVTHYISEVRRIKKTNLIIKDHNPYYNYYKDYEFILKYLDLNTEGGKIDSNDYYLYKLSYKDKENTIKYIKNSLIKAGGYYLPVKRSFYSGFLFVFSPETEIMAISFPSAEIIRENNADFESYHYVSTVEPNNGYNLKGYYIKDESHIPIIENFYKLVKDTFNLTKIEVAQAEGGPIYPYNSVLLDPIKSINIYCNSDYNDTYKKGSLLNDKMKIVYFNHSPFVQKWYQKAIEDNGVVTTESPYSTGLFVINKSENYTEEWLDEFNAKANTDRLLHPEFLLLGTEDPSEQGEYSFTIEFIYNNGQKIVQETPAFHLLREFY